MIFDEAQISNENGTSATVGLKQWLILDCIMFLNIIPVIGSVAALVIYLILAFGNRAAPSIRYRIMASLIWCVVAFILVIILTTAGLVTFASLASNQPLTWYNKNNMKGGLA